MRVSLPAAYLRRFSQVKAYLVLASSLLLSLCLGAYSPATAEVNEDSRRILVGSCDLPVRVWSDNSIKTRGVIVAIHGAARHSGTYEVLAQHLASMGYLVYSPDMRGHGQWYYADWSTPADKIVDWDKSTDDTVGLIDKLRREYPQLPIFCLGESAGSAVAIKVADRCPEIRGLILSAIGTTPCVHDVPTVFRDTLIGATNFNKPLDVRETLEKYSSDNEKVREDAAKDPLGKNGLSVRELLRTSWLLSRTYSFAAKLPANIPVLMIQGANDRIVKASSARAVLKHIACTDKVFKAFPSGHILLSTPFIRDDVMSCVSDWLVAKTVEQQTALLTPSTTVK